MYISLPSHDINKKKIGQALQTPPPPVS